jgi:hypothetical protein
LLSKPIFIEMTDHELLRIRLNNQQLINPEFKTPGEVVRWLGAVQAQDYLHSLWGIGQRLNNAREVIIEKAVLEKSIVRSWPMRGTLHFIPAEDLRWMLKYLTPRVVKRQNALFLKAGLDKTVFTKCRKIIIDALKEFGVLTREELYGALEKKKISTANVRGLHITFVLAQEQIICFGPRNGKQQTFTLLDEWLPPSKNVTWDEALYKLAFSYFRSHGPATADDLAWWAGLTKTEAKGALESVKSKFVSENVSGREYWFSPDIPTGRTIPNIAHFVSVYDEYGIAYKDRSALVQGKRAEKLKGRDFLNMVMVKGQIGGFWKRTLGKGKVVVDVSALTPFSVPEKEMICEAVKRYGKFLSLEPQLKIDSRLFPLG